MKAYRVCLLRAEYRLRVLCRGYPLFSSRSTTRLDCTCRNVSSGNLPTAMIFGMMAHDLYNLFSHPAFTTAATTNKHYDVICKWCK